MRAKHQHRVVSPEVGQRRRADCGVEDVDGDEGACHHERGPHVVEQDRVVFCAKDKDPHACCGQSEADGAVLYSVVGAAGVVEPSVAFVAADAISVVRAAGVGGVDGGRQRLRCKFVLRTFIHSGIIGRDRDGFQRRYGINCKRLKISEMHDGNVDNYSSYVFAFDVVLVADLSQNV